jgi:hypothetical protein
MGWKTGRLLNRDHSTILRCHSRGLACTLLRTRNGSTPVGYAGRGALKREQCDVPAEGRNNFKKQIIHC